MNWFGKNWGAPICQEEDHVPIPVGELCFHCDEPIGESDNGLIMPIGSFEPSVPKSSPMHFECFMRGITGSVGHQKKTCSCFGGTEEDPIGMTVREAAKAAYKVYVENIVL